MGPVERPNPPGGQISAGAGLLSSLRATLWSFGRQPPPASAPAAEVFLPLAPWAWDCAAFRGRGFCLPRTTAALAGPWALPSRPARRAAVPGFEMAPSSRRIAGSPLRGPRSDPGASRSRASKGELDIGGRGLDPGASPPPVLPLRRRPSWPRQFTITGLQSACQEDDCRHTERHLHSPPLATRG